MLKNILGQLRSKGPTPAQVAEEATYTSSRAGGTTAPATGANVPDWYMRFPPYSDDVTGLVVQSDDPVRYASVALAISSLLRRGVPGAFAELGVYKGHLSRFIHTIARERRYYLFDTFAGFPPEDLSTNDTRFDDTSLDLVIETIGDLENIVIRKGYFPQTSEGLESERFAFVMLDADLYKPTLAGLKFFYPRLSPGGYLVLHDYNSPESNWAVSTAVAEFNRDFSLTVIEIPDKWGSAIITKARP